MTQRETTLTTRQIENAMTDARVRPAYTTHAYTCLRLCSDLDDLARSITELRRNRAEWFLAV
jgi:hypothetical protein